MGEHPAIKTKFRSSKNRRYYNGLTLTERNKLRELVTKLPLGEAADIMGVADGTAYKVHQMVRAGQ